MERFLIEELRARCEEISWDVDNEPMISKVVEAYKRISEFSKISRREGLLALEEAKDKLDLEDDTQKLLADLILLIVDGTDPELVRKIGVNKYVASGLQSYLGLICLMYIHGSLMIQAGENKAVIEYMLKSMMPKKIYQQVENSEDKKEQGDLFKIALDVVEELYGESQKKDHSSSIVDETSRALLSLTDPAIQRIIMETDHETLVIAMRGMSGDARARILNNMSARLATTTAELMGDVGALNLSDIEDECTKLAKNIVKLFDFGEICGYDFSRLKEVLNG